MPVGNDFIWNLGQNKIEHKKEESKKLETRTKQKMFQSNNFHDACTLDKNI